MHKIAHLASVAVSTVKVVLHCYSGPNLHSRIWPSFYDHTSGLMARGERDVSNHLGKLIPEEEVDVRAADGNLLDLDEHLVLDRLGDGQVGVVVALLGLLLDHGLHGVGGHLDVKRTLQGQGCATVVTTLGQETNGLFQTTRICYVCSGSINRLMEFDSRFGKNILHQGLGCVNIPNH